jgi:hypothetical protein
LRKPRQSKEVKNSIAINGINGRFNGYEALAKKKLLSSGHLSVDGTPIQAWAGHKSFQRKDGDYAEWMIAIAGQALDGDGMPITHLSKQLG